MILRIPLQYGVNNNSAYLVEETPQNTSGSRVGAGVRVGAEARVGGGWVCCCSSDTGGSGGTGCSGGTGNAVGSIGAAGEVQDVVHFAVGGYEPEEGGERGTEIVTVEVVCV